MTARPRRSLQASLIIWTASLISAAGLLWLSSRHMPLWPPQLSIARPDALWLAVGLYVPYMIVRAHRLVFVLDPLVRHGGGDSIDRRLVLGSGFVSFFVVLVLPLRLGELSRPLLLGRAETPGVSVASALSAVAIERIVDGLLICGMLFLGLSLSPLDPDVDAQTVHGVARVTTVVFVLALLVLVVMARVPGSAAGVAARLTRPLGAFVSTRVVAATEAVTVALSDLVRSGRGAWFLGSSVVYWGVTVAHFWALALAVGVPLTAAQSAVLVSVIGLAIQLPGGPAQSGSFQVGAAMGLSLFVDLAHSPGAAAFAALAFVFQLVGTAVTTLPGLALLSAAARTNEGP